MTACLTLRFYLIAKWLDLAKGMFRYDIAVISLTDYGDLLKIVDESSHSKFTSCALIRRLGASPLGSFEVKFGASFGYEPP